jgi:hypothetical protein
LAGSLGSSRSNARRVRRLEQEVKAVEPSQTELEVWALDAEIRRLEEEIVEAGGDPHDIRMGVGWEGHAAPGRSLDEQIAVLEAEIEEDERED